MVRMRGQVVVKVVPSPSQPAPQPNDQAGMRGQVVGKKMASMTGCCQAHATLTPGPGCSALSGQRSRRSVCASGALAEGLGSEVQRGLAHRHAGVHLRHAGALRGLGVHHRAQQLRQRRQPRAVGVRRVQHRQVTAPGRAAASVPPRLRARAYI